MSQNARSDEAYGKYDFLKWGKYFFAISMLTTLLSLVLIVTKGLNYGVDFAGGTEIQIQFSKGMDASAIRNSLETSGFPQASVQAYGGDKEYLIRFGIPEGGTEAERNKKLQDSIVAITGLIQKEFADANPEIRQIETVGPQVGVELKKKGILAGFYCLLLILIYLGLRFDYKYAPGAVICLFHDSIVTMGIYSLFGLEFSVQTMAAVLTIMGYSLNDTIVIFDRIRENSHIYRGKGFYWLSNRSLNDCLSRTLLTFFATFITVVAMFVLADGVIRDFALAMMIGMILGVYSTMYVATPLVILFDKLEKSKA